MKIDYAKLERITNDIKQSEMALQKLQDMAKHLAETRRKMNVGIKLEVIGVAEFIPNERNNVHYGGIIDAKGNNASEVLFNLHKTMMELRDNMEGLDPKLNPQQNMVKMGVEQEGVPPELALLMLGVMRDYYKAELLKSKEQMEDYIRSCFQKATFNMDQINSIFTETPGC